MKKLFSKFAAGLAVTAAIFGATLTASAQINFADTATVTTLIGPLACPNTNSPIIDVSGFVGKPILMLVATNLIGDTLTCNVVSTNTVNGNTGSFTNAFAVVNGPTNNVQALGFDTTAYGTKLQVQIAITGNLMSNTCWVGLIGRKKYN